MGMIYHSCFPLTESKLIHGYAVVKIRNLSEALNHHF